MSKVLVITALQEELEAVLRLKPNAKEDWSRRQTENGYLLYEAEFEDDLGNPFEIIASAQPAKGVVASAAHTTRMLRFSPDLVFMTGICAGRRKKGVELGDVVVGNMAFHYEVGKKNQGNFEPEMSNSRPNPQMLQWLNDFESTNIDLGELIQMPRPTSLRFQREWILFTLDGKAKEGSEWPRTDEDFTESRIACPNWEEAVASLVNDDLIEHCAGFCLTSKGKATLERSRTQSLLGQPRPDRKEPKIWIGAFATGSSVVSENDFFDKLAQRERTVLALDMEASAFLDAVNASGRNLPCAVIKGSSDYADGEKDDSFHRYAAEAAARFMFVFAKFALPLLQVGNEVTTDSRTITYPIPLPRPATTYEDRVKWHAALQWPSGEEQFFGERYKEDNYSGLEFYNLGRKRFLLEVSLGFAVYQGSYLYIFLNESGETPIWNVLQFRKIYVDSFEDGELVKEALEDEIVGLPYFDEKSHTLSVFTKSRGIGDCGAVATYDIKEGKAILTEWRHKGCDDFNQFSAIEEDADGASQEEYVEPDEWPLIDITKKYPVVDFSMEN